MKRFIQAIIATSIAFITLFIASPANAGPYYNSTMYKRTIYVLVEQNAYTSKWAMPTARAVWKYNDSPAINVYNWGKCYSATNPCIVVRPYWAEDSRYGYAQWWYDSRGVSYGIAWLNTRYASTDRQKQAVACHEIGHIIGLAHDPNRVSCMGKGDANGPYPYPSSYDYWVIQYKYNYEKRPW